MFLFSHPDFKDLLVQVAGQKKVGPAVVEKDYWVTFSLYHMTKSEFKDEFIFKGGTSLSKAFNLINRFSEDIDLLFIKKDSVNERTQLKKVEKFMDSQDGLTYIKDHSDNFSGSKKRVSCFDYKKDHQDSLGSLLPYIKFEMSYRGGPTPNETKLITSFLAEALLQNNESGKYNDLQPFPVQVLSPERTFVEKKFALHAAYVDGIIEEKVRHYYDLYHLLDLAQVQKFLGTPEHMELKKDIHSVSKENFPNSVPQVDQLHESKAFSPTEEWKKRISTAHDRSDLIYGEKPSMDEIFAKIKQFLAKF